MKLLKNPPIGRWRCGAARGVIIRRKQACNRSRPATGPQAGWPRPLCPRYSLGPLPGSISIPNPFSLTTRCLFIPVRYADVRPTQWVSLSSGRSGEGRKGWLQFARSTRYSRYWPSELSLILLFGYSSVHLYVCYALVPKHYVDWCQCEGFLYRVT